MKPSQQVNQYVNTKSHLKLLGFTKYMGTRAVFEDSCKCLRKYDAEERSKMEIQRVIRFCKLKAYLGKLMSDQDNDGFHSTKKCFERSQRCTALLCWDSDKTG